MPSPRSLPIVWTALLLIATSLGARAQCDTWRDLPALTATGYAGNPTAYANDEVQNKLYAVEQCYCGWHGINLPTVYVWTGTNFAPLTWFEDGVANGIGVFDSGAGRMLHLWGSQHSWPPVASFLRYTGTVWEPATSVSPNVPYAVVQFDDGTGLTFYIATQSSVQRWTGTSWVSIGATLPSSNGWATALVVHDDGSGPALHASGAFTSIGGVPAAGIARWNGTTWSSLGTGLESSTSVMAAGLMLRSFQDGPTRSLYVGGRFTTAGGNPANGIARWNGTSWTGLGVGIPSASTPGIIATVTGMEWFDEGTGFGAHLYIGGTTQPYVPFLSRLDGDQWTPVSGFSGAGYFNGPPLGTFDFPETPGLDLLSATGGTYNQHPIALGACAWTGVISCLGDGSGTACPCGNESTPAERAGCNNSLGHGAALRATGRASLTGDSVALEGSAMPNSAVLYFQGASAVAQHVFGDGLKCTGGPFVRLATKINASGASVYPSTGDAAVSAKGQVHAPGMRHYQLRYRNAGPFCTTDTFNYSNAVDILWTP